MRLSSVALLNNLPDAAAPIFEATGAFCTLANAHKGALPKASVFAQLDIVFSPLLNC
jgi:hypothetical protein